MRWFRGANRDLMQGEPTPVSDTPLTSASGLWDAPLTAVNYFVVDMETSGFSAETDLILSFAAGCFTGTNPHFTETLYELIQHDNVERVPASIWDLTGLTPEEIRAGRELSDVLRHALAMAVDRVWIAHHAGHEMSFLQRQVRQLWKLKLRPVVIDTAVVAQALGQVSRVPSLEEACTWLGVDVQDRHRADADVRMTAEVWRREIQLCQQVGLQTVSEVIDWTSSRAMG